MNERTTDRPAIAFKLGNRDNVAIANQDFDVGHAVRIVLFTPDASEPIAQLTVTDFIPYAHKVALLDIAAGEEITKFGVAVGRAKEFIARGRLVHVHNVVSLRGIARGGEDEK